MSNGGAQAASAVRMARGLTWFSRVALAAVLLVAALGAVDANDRFAALSIRPDRVNHAVLAYALALLTMASFRRAHPLAVAGLMMTVGIALEAVQWLGLFAGDAQWGDLAADFIGTALAVTPMWVGRVQGRRNADATPAATELVSSRLERPERGEVCATVMAGAPQARGALRPLMRDPATD